MLLQPPVKNKYKSLLKQVWGVVWWLQHLAASLEGHLSLGCPPAGAVGDSVLWRRQCWGAGWELRELKMLCLRYSKLGPGLAKGGLYVYVVVEVWIYGELAELYGITCTSKAFLLFQLVCRCRQITLNTRNNFSRALLSLQQYRNRNLEAMWNHVMLSCAVKSFTMR